MSIEMNKISENLGKIASELISIRLIFQHILTTMEQAMKEENNVSHLPNGHNDKNRK
jgi:hypothetical protein